MDDQSDVDLMRELSLISLRIEKLNQLLFWSEEEPNEQWIVGFVRELRKLYRRRLELERALGLQG